MDKKKFPLNFCWNSCHNCHFTTEETDVSLKQQNTSLCKHGREKGRKSGKDFPQFFLGEWGYDYSGRWATLFCGLIPFLLASFLKILLTYPPPPHASLWGVLKNYRWSCFVENNHTLYHYFIKTAIAFYSTTTFSL